MVHIVKSVDATLQFSALISFIGSPVKEEGTVMKKLVWLSICVGLWGLLHTAAAVAVSLDFVPSSQEVQVGQPVSVDIFISGLGEGIPPSVGAFDLDVSFDPAILSPTGVAFGPFLGIPFVDALVDANFPPGVIDLAEVSLLPSADLDLLQPAAFPLATLFFDTLALGTSPLIFSQVIVDDAFGGKLDVITGSGSVGVVPEPGTLLLMGIGLVMVGFGRKRLFKKNRKMSAPHISTTQNPGPLRIGVLPALICAIGLLHGIQKTQAATVFIDSVNPTGIPDIHQSNPMNAGNGNGICGAASMANLLWNWSETPPYDGSAGGQRLVDHPNSAAPPQNWPATFGNWFADSLTLRNRLETLIYGTANNGFGQAGGTTRYIKERGHLFSSGFFGFGANPNGLSVRTYNKGQATYQGAYNSLLNAQNQVLFAEVETHWVWHTPDGNFVQNNGGKSRHALSVAGLDAPVPANNDPGNRHIYVTNGWGSHQGQPNPVSTAYYDLYTNIIIDNSGGGNPNNRFRIPAGAGANNGGAGNNMLVRGIANSNNAGNQADYVEMYQYLVVKRGGSPDVGLEVTLSGTQNIFTYRVHNPEPNAQHHFFLQIAPGVLNQLSLGSIQSPPGWQVEFWNPGGPIANPVNSLNPSGLPDDGEDLFGPQVNEEGGGFNLPWQPTWRGLHWYWTGSTGSPLNTGNIFDFSFLLDSATPFTLEPVALTVVGELSHEVHYYNMIGGPTVRCDVDGSGIINLDDINTIFRARNTPAELGDPRDADGDRIITVNDARICATRCTNPRCGP